jgi:hypothetical protein
MQSVNISRLSSGGLKIIIDELSPATYTNKISYRSFINGIMLYDESTREILVTPYTQDLFIVDGITSFTTIEEVCTALDNIGLVSKSQIVIVDNNGNTLNPNGLPYVETIEITRPANTTAYTAKDAINSSTSEPVAFEFEQMAITNGGGGMLMDIKVESDMTTIASTTLRLWFFNEAPSSIISDNAAFANAYTDRDKRIFYVDVEMDAQEGSSTSIVGQASVIKEYKCADTSLFMQVETIEGFTPTSGGKINVTLTVLKLS